MTIKRKGFPGRHTLSLRVGILMGRRIDGVSPDAVTLGLTLRH